MCRARHTTTGCKGPAERAVIIHTSTIGFDVVVKVSGLDYKLKSMLTEKEEKYISQRRFFTKLGPWVGTILLFIIIIFWGYLFLNTPLLVNPFHALNQIEKGEMSESSFIILATMGSIAFLIIGFLLLVFIVATFFVGMTNERKLIAIIDVLRKKGNKK